MLLLVFKKAVAIVRRPGGHCQLTPEQAFSQFSGKLALSGHYSKLACGDHCYHYFKKTKCDYYEFVFMFVFVFGVVMCMLSVSSLCMKTPQ